MNYDLLNWFVSLLALSFACLHIYLQYFRKGKLICEIERILTPIIDIDLDEEKCKFEGIINIFKEDEE